MHLSLLTHHKAVLHASFGSAGKSLPDARARRSSYVTAATRGDWRAAIEGSTSSCSSSSSSGSADNSAAAKRGSAKVATTTLQPPAQPKPASPSAAATAPAAAPPPSPWSQPAEMAAAPPSPPPPPAPPAASGPSTAAPDGSRTEPLSLPTFDLVEMLADPKSQSTAFTALAATSAILATLCLLEPQAVLHLALPKASTSDLDVTFLRIAGVTLAASASVEYSLKHAAESQLLKSATYQRLMAGCAVKSAGFLAVLFATTPATFRLWNPLVWVSYAVTAVAAGAINLSVISHTSGKGLAPPPLEPSAPQSAASWGYTACAALYLLTLMACFAPETLFTGDPYSAVTPLVKGVWAPGFFLAAVMSYVLKDAADRGRLGASTFKNLNLGLAALEYGYSIIFGSAILSDQVDIDLPALSNLGGSLLIATFALYIYATAKK